MNKQSITFSASEQTLEKTGGIDNYASNIVSYVEATFTLGENWTGYDVVRAVWESAYAKISTVLDSDHKCVVPAEVLRHKSKVNVNLVGSIVTNDVLTDRLTTYPVHAITVDADARVDSTETQPITPSQFEQFVEAVHADAESIQDYSYDSEAWAKGTRGGVAVPSTDPTYHNNSKYYADQGAELEQEVSDLKSDINDNASDISALQTSVANLGTHKVAQPLDEDNQPTDGTDGQSLRTKGDGTTEWADIGLPTDEQTAAAVSAWLDEHPEATTTVEDGSLTEAKLSTVLKLNVLKDYVTPEMFGAKGDGVTDDTDAIQQALNSGSAVMFLNKTYGVKDSLTISSNTTIVGDNSCIKALSGYAGLTKGLFSIDTQTDIFISSLEIDGNSILDIAIYIEASSHVLLDNLNIHDCESAESDIIAVLGVYVAHSSDIIVYRTTIDRVEYSGSARLASRCISFYQSVNCKVDSCELYKAIAPIDHGVSDGDGDGDGIHLRFNGNYDTELPANMIITNTVISGCTKRCIKIQQYGVIVDKCRFPYVSDDTSLYNSCVAIYDDYATISNNYFDAKGSIQIDIGYATDTSETEITNILICGNTFNLRGQAYQGAVVVEDTGRKVNGLKMIGNSIISAYASEYALYIRRNAENVIFANNTMKGGNMAVYVRLSGSSGADTIKNLIMTNNDVDIDSHFITLTNIMTWQNIILMNNACIMANLPNYYKNILRVTNSVNSDLVSPLFSAIEVTNNSVNTGAQGLIAIGYLNQRPNISYSSGFANHTVIPPRGFMYYSLDDYKPIWWNGSEWKDATGTTVS